MVEQGRMKGFFGRGKNSDFLEVNSFYHFNFIPISIPADQFKQTSTRNDNGIRNDTQNDLIQCSLLKERAPD